jgi:hypothetical protein
MTKTAKIQPVVLSDNVGLFSICFDNATENEFEKFIKKFRDDATLNEDYQAIVSALKYIVAKGALERRFRMEGKMNDDLVALPIERSRIRLYCLRMSDQVLIVGNGGIKNARTYEESEELNGYVIDLQKFDKILRQALKDGSIRIERNVIIGIEEATFEI